MSMSEDDTFCHYCGRSVTPNLALNWDHVPALNVKIPEEYGIQHDVRRTLIRACAECNILASDAPHLDYLERHFWLKIKYLRRYKSILINEDPTTSETTDLENITRSKPTIKELLAMLGFGVKEVELIKSPIIEVKNKPTRKKISTLILENLTFSPHDIQEDDNEELVLGEEASMPDDIYIPDFDFLFDLLISERENGEVILDNKSLSQWVDKYPTRSKALELYSDYISSYRINWTILNKAVNAEFDANELSISQEEFRDLALGLIDSLLTTAMVYHETKLNFKSFLFLCQTLRCDQSKYIELIDLLTEFDLDIHFHRHPEKEYYEFSWQICWLD